MGCLSTNDDSIFVREKDIERLTATTAEMVGPKVAIRFSARLSKQLQRLMQHSGRPRTIPVESQ